MVLGLAIYGYKVVTAIGVKIAKITPSRGFSIELGAAMVIVIGTRLQLPLSSTHCQVGATAGVALCEVRGCQICSWSLGPWRRLLGGGVCMACVGGDSWRRGGVAWMNDGKDWSGHCHHGYRRYRTAPTTPKMSLTNVERSTRLQEDPYSLRGMHSMVLQNVSAPYPKGGRDNAVCR